MHASGCLDNPAKGCAKISVKSSIQNPIWRRSNQTGDNIDTSFISADKRLPKLQVVASFAKLSYLLSILIVYQDLEFRQGLSKVLHVLVLDGRKSGP